MVMRCPQPVQAFDSHLLASAKPIPAPGLQRPSGKRTAPRALGKALRLIAAALRPLNAGGRTPIGGCRRVPTHVRSDCHSH